MNNKILFQAHFITPRNYSENENKHIYLTALDSPEKYEKFVWFEDYSGESSLEQNQKVEQSLFLNIQKFIQHSNGLKPELLHINETLHKFITRLWKM